MDLWALYGSTLKSRLFEEAVARLWCDGLISGEMHLGTGEEAIIAGVVTQLREGDAMALDHRGTAAMLMRGVDPVLILRELLGRPDGLCGGMGGHMHLFSREHLAASSGIVGAEGPAAAGYALSAQSLRPGAIAVAFFGDGAMNQGMLMESMNLASAWKLPVLFVCKDDGWAITTESVKVTGGDLVERVRAFGIPTADVDGCEVFEVWEAARSAIERARGGQGPSFLHARCIHLEGHFLGFPLAQGMSDTIREMPRTVLPLAQSVLTPGGAALRERVTGMKTFLGTVRSAFSDPRRDPENDPVRRLRKALPSDPERLQGLEEQVEKEISRALESALAEMPS
jgi:pyruvate dehydrogenase E1 component alpha subunit